MPAYHAVSRERHSQKRWFRSSSYRFAAADTVAPLVAAEMFKAALSLPMAFIEQGDAFIPVAVLGLRPGDNLFVASDGRWVGQYIPAVFRAYPFRLANTEDGQQVLCVDEDGDLITDSPKGELFFDQEDQPAKAVVDILNFLNQVEQSRQSTIAACAILKKHNLIQPWPITVKGAVAEEQIGGLYRIDESALNQLSAEALLDVRNAGALPIAYCQLLSMQHLPLLGQLSEAQAKNAAAQMSSLHDLAPNGELDLEFFNKGGTFNFSGLF